VTRLLEVFITTYTDSFSTVYSINRLIDRIAPPHRKTDTTETMSRAYFTKLTDLEDLDEGEGDFEEIEDELDQDLMTYTTGPVAHTSALTMDMLHYLLVPEWEDGDPLSYGTTIVHYAALKNIPDAIRMLVLVHKVDPEGVDHRGNTPLMAAVKACKVMSVASLIRVDVNINARDGTGFTALHHAAYQGGFSGKNCKIIELLIDAGADIDTLSEGNSTPLHMSCMAGHVKQSILLLRYGAKFDLCDIRGFTPLHLSVTKNSNTTLVSILLACGASPNTVNYINGSPLHDAIKFCDDPEDMICTLMASHPDTDIWVPDNEGNTLLHKCASLSTWLMEMIMPSAPTFQSETPIVNAVNNAGNTPLHHIAITGHAYGVPTVGVLYAMQLLLDNGASMQMRNNMGMTTRESASLRKLDDVVALLDKEVRQNLESLKIDNQARKPTLAFALKLLRDHQHS
jgi:ankyrin repeat protein